MPSAKETVALSRVTTTVDQAVRNCLTLLEDPLSDLAADMRVLLKPNMFQLDRPFFFTNPEILLSLARIVRERGATPIVVERLRNLYTLLEDSPIHDYAEVLSLDDNELRITEIDGATSLRAPLAIPEILLDCDYFIGVPQLRTHASVLLTNAMKNLVGLLPGYTTRLVHLSGVDESIVDLNVLRPQNLVVCDLTTIIEGNYPIAGSPKEVGLILASRSAVAADAVAAHISGFSPSSIPYLTHANQRGLGAVELGDIDVRGLSLGEAAFSMEKAPASMPELPNVRVFAETACDACQRFIAGVLKAIEPEIRSWDGRLLVYAGARPNIEPASGNVVLVGNALYEQRERGIYVEGCPPRAIQLGAFRFAMGFDVTARERSQFRVPLGWSRNAP